MIRKPKALTDFENSNQELLSEKSNIKNEVFFDKNLSDEEANKIISDFNSRYLIAGGPHGGTITLRNQSFC